MKITMAHGGGGTETKRLIETVFSNVFGGDSVNDAFTNVVPPQKKFAFTTDSFVVTPVEFPGGNIGRLAVCGTVNDLLTSGAVPGFLSAAFIIEEGFETETLSRIARSMKETADEANVRIVTGDTKVTERVPSREPSVYINTSGIGFLNAEAVTPSGIKPGDKLLVTGTMGDHHACILSARMGLTNRIESDAAPLTGMVAALMESGARVTCLRDITRGGLAGVLNELGAGAEIYESAVPVSEEVRGLCGILGLDPLYMGNEGKMLVAVDAADAGRALEIISRAGYSSGAAVIGEVTDGARVVLNTAYGRRILPPMAGEGLPRIC